MLYGVDESAWMDGCHVSSFLVPKALSPSCESLSVHWPSCIVLGWAHHSHISIELIWLAKKHNVHFLSLPPSTTHIFQPLDVGTFSLVKKAWKKILKRWKLQTRGQTVSKEAFPSLISEL